MQKKEDCAVVRFCNLISNSFPFHSSAEIRIGNPECKKIWHEYDIATCGMNAQFLIRNVRQFQRAIPEQCVWQK